MRIDLQNSVYLLPPSSLSYFEKALDAFDERITALRGVGTLTDKTLERYYGSTKWEQIAESNAIEGSTLSVGETELAVLSGMTLSGHDEGYVKDAQTLHKAIVELASMAKIDKKTDVEEIKRIHSMILEGREAAGVVREDQIMITGTKHRPPKHYGEIMEMLDDLEAWSLSSGSHPIIRAAVLHCWIVHIHPFRDGNGRTARAVGNLQLIRYGLPPTIIKKVEKTTYLEGIRLSDDGGDISQFLEFYIRKANGALVGLENAAREMQGYSPAETILRNRQLDLLRVWNTATILFRQMLSQELDSLQGKGVISELRIKQDEIDIDDYRLLSERNAAGNHHLFTLSINIPTLGVNSLYLFWVGYRSNRVQHADLTGTQGPSMYVSKRSGGYPPWDLDQRSELGFTEATIKPGYGDTWFSIGIDDKVRKTTLTKIVKDMVIKCVELT